MKMRPLSVERFFTSLLNATYWFDDAFQLSLEASGLERTTRAESFVIVNIAAGERRAIQIAQNLGVSRQAISQIIKDMERRGIIVSHQDPNDGRARVVSFSKSFEEHGDICSKIVTGIVRELEQRLGKVAIDRFRSTLAADWGQPPKVRVDNPGTSSSKRVKRSSEKATGAETPSRRGSVPRASAGKRRAR
ncbi:MAG: MarR family transcriptional regulator [Rhodospirillaceae bacterium]|nr:MAG: MarR family transcriptional regulator [Rhodospirillaceae bacterium]